MWRFRCLVLLFAVLVICPAARASFLLEPGDEAYDDLVRLEAVGIIRSGLLTAGPLSSDEVIRLIREAEGSPGEKSPLVLSIMESIRERFSDDVLPKPFIKPLEDTGIRYVYADSDRSKMLSYNNDGDVYGRGSNVRLGTALKGRAGKVVFSIDPEIRYSDGDTDLVLKKAYAVLTLSNVAIEIGKTSRWWGPGYHGALLVSNNSEPLTAISITNPHPAILPSVLRYLGLFRFSFFVSELEKDREISRPYLWGLRVTMKPSPYLEIGLHRTAILGGEGRSEDLATWFKSFTGKGENDTGGGAGDQKAGLDFRVTLPNRWQPVQIYGETAGEDEANGMPSKLAYIVGLYIPGAGRFERFDFRAEYANNHIKGSPDVWYNHYVYTSGYRYKGRIIGHHMGTDSRDLFLGARYLLHGSMKGSIAFSYDREQHDLSEKGRGTIDELSFRFHVSMREKIDLEATYLHANVEAPDSSGRGDETINMIGTRLTYRF